LVAEPHFPAGCALKLPHQPANRRRIVARLPLHRTAFTRQEHRHADRFLVYVQPHEGGTLLHDRLLSYAALVPLQSGTTPRSSDPEPVAPYGLISVLGGPVGGLALSPSRAGFLGGVVAFVFYAGAMNTMLHGWVAWYRLARDGRQTLATVTRRQPEMHQ